ncbi:hypothetical protein ACQF52_17030 [Klebsiella pneumoniae]
MKINKNNFGIYMLYVYPVIFYQFYHYISINVTIAKLLFFAMISGLIVYLMPSLFKIKRKSKYEIPFRLLLLIIVFSMFSSLLFWGQDIILSFRATAPYLGLIYFFLLMKVRPEKEQLERIAFLFCCIYIVLWCYGMIKAPQVIFSSDPDAGIDDSRGIFRLSLEGKGFLVLGFFIAVTKYVYERNVKWLVCFVFLFAIIILQVARQMILFSFLISAVYLLRKTKWLWMIVALATLVIIVNGINININDDGLVSRLIYISTKQLQEHNTGNENVRLLEYQYFLTSYSKNIFTDIFGNGVPHVESLYGHKEVNIKEQFAYFLSDVGYAEVFIRFGFIGLFLYILMFLRAAKQSVSSDIVYAKMLIIYIACVSVTSSWIFKDIIPICISFYLLEMDNLSRLNKLKK